MTLASGGVIVLDPSTTITFASNHLFQPNCAATDGFYYSSNSAVEDNKAPFYASTTVLIYVVATTTVIAWLLFILLLIAPGNFAGKSAPNTSAWFRGRAIPNFVSNGISIIKFGSRPWLQKAAAFLVTIALTIASAKTFDVAATQYNLGYMNAESMRNDVVDSNVIKVLRVVSDIFIWLAQVQTLIRLFPRRKEKLIIKWFGFLLILLDTIFACLNSFYVKTEALPRWYSDAIPALSYLFQLSISLLYGAWVCYYVATKRRYAFINKEMPNIAIISTLAIVSILIPVGFFVADVSVPVVAGWGDFFRWVGAVAASVLVWEWVERIEFLEREEKKGGILGREIFEEDEMYDGNTLGKGRSASTGDHRSSDPGNVTRALVNVKNAFTRLAARPRLRPKPSNGSMRSGFHTGDEQIPIHDLPTHHNFNEQPANANTPVSRTETDTPSTVYDVHYHPVMTTPPATNHQTQPSQRRLTNIAESATSASSTRVASTGTRADDSHIQLKDNNIAAPPLAVRPLSTHSVTRPNPTINVRRGVQYTTSIFKRGKRSPPLEVKRAMSALHPDTTGPAADSAPSSRKGKGSRKLKSMVGRFVGTDGHEPEIEEQELEPTVIPAPPRGQTWSPAAMRHSPVGARAVNESMDAVVAGAEEVRDQQ